MRKIKFISISLSLLLLCFSIAYAATCRCSSSVDSKTSIDYAWTSGTTTEVAIVRINGKQAATYTLAVVDVPCIKEVQCK